MVLLDVRIFVDQSSELETHHRRIFELENFGEDGKDVGRRSLLVPQKRSPADLNEESLERVGTRARAAVKNASLERSGRRIDGQTDLKRN